MEEIEEEINPQIDRLKEIKIKDHHGRIDHQIDRDLDLLNVDAPSLQYLKVRLEDLLQNIDEVKLKRNR